MSERTVRFAVGDPEGLSSNSWRVWVNAGDVYIACRDNYQALKVSLHRSGRWRVGLTAVGAAETQDRRPAGEDRAWEVWDRPSPDRGVIIAYQIEFLPSELAITPAVRESLNWKKVEFLTTPVADLVAVATVSLHESGAPVLQLDHVERQVFSFLDMPDGGRVQITIHTEAFGEDRRQGLATAYRQARGQILAAGYGPPADGRQFLHGRRGDDRVRFAVEVNAARPAPDPLRLLD